MKMESEGAAVTRLVIARDVTERRQAEAERESLIRALEAKNAELERFTYTVSHDLRSPLVTIGAFISHVEEAAERGDLSSLRADLGRIRRASQKMDLLLRDLLDLSRVQAGTTIATVAITPVDDLVGAALQRVSGAMPGRDIRVSLEEGGTLMVGQFDLAASLRILVNLLENADKYSPPAAPIVLSATHRGEWIDITVADGGAGVPVDERERIFEPFYRPPGSLAESNGAGLGLAIARGLAEAQGGQLRYVPGADGGAAFTLSLRAAELPVRILTL